MAEEQNPQCQPGNIFTKIETNVQLKNNLKFYKKKKKITTITNLHLEKNIQKTGKTWNEKKIKSRKTFTNFSKIDKFDRNW